jgi:hypothetical protein
MLMVYPGRKEGILMVRSREEREMLMAYPGRKEEMFIVIPREERKDVNGISWEERRNVNGYVQGGKKRC